MIENVRQAVQNANLYTYLGKIDKIVGTTVEAMGPACRIGDVCTIDVPGDNPPVKAEVVGFRENRVLLMPYEETEGIGYGSAVRNTGERLLIPVSNELVGRTVDAMGIPIDGQGPLREVAYYPITGKRSNPMERPRIDTVIQMGVKAIDGLLTIGKGQRMGIFAGSGVGKSTLMGMIAKNVKADVNVIALVGERSREVVEFINRDLGEEGLKRSVLVVATSNQSAMMRSKCTMTATTIAEYFKDQGMDVLLMMDSLTRFAMAQREVGLSIGEPPVARGYTPSIYSELPKLLERSGNFETGSITGIYTVLVEGDDANEPVSDTVRGIIDGHIMLSRKVATQNRYPAIDILSSVSRLMSDIVMPEHKAAAGKIRKLLSVYESNIDLVSIGAYKKGTNKELDDALMRIDKIYEFLQQKTDESFSLDEAVIRMIQLTE
ncbi:FliI/YscN family ATPase [Hungatella hominis]|uniref:FliI/YscN family ATPase n=1 Tax=Hungatella hominis TaxID=2763050 RepID=A0ABR7HD39_9FIRM|nr:FliI/YscN family ATPase [Hungatella hominis]MBC5711101.1 FliI/YscN family ATPase [Hungatella hominis]